MKRQSNQKKIDEVEINSFLKEWLKNTEKTLKFGDIEVPQQMMLWFYKDFLNSFLKNSRRHRIYGVDKMIGFEINIANDEALLKICQDIWDSPEDYYTIEDDDANYYYEFLKFLWVASPDRDEVRLVDLVDTKLLD